MAKTLPPRTVVETPEMELARLRAENAQLIAEDEARRNKPLTIKISEKTGAVCIYNLGRYPVTMYEGQARKLIAFIPQLEKFLNDNSHLLSQTKAESDARKAAHLAKFGPDPKKK